MKKKTFQECVVLGITSEVRNKKKYVHKENIYAKGKYQYTEKMQNMLFEVGIRVHFISAIKETFYLASKLLM